MSYRIIFTKSASRDLGEIGDYVRNQAGPAAEERLLEEIIAAVETLRLMPTRQRERSELKIWAAQPFSQELYDFLSSR